MGTTAEKLTYLNTTKQEIKDGLNNLGAEITDNDTFRSYANALADIYDELPKVTGSGTDLELTPTKKGKLAITSKGNSSQESTTGYNIMNFDVEGQNSKVTVNDDGTVTINGKGGFGLKFKEITLLANETYKQKVEIVSGSTTSGSIASTFMSFDGSLWLTTSRYLSYTPTEDITRSSLWVNASAEFNNLRIKIWGFKGTDEKDFERATDGPAPNPSYPYPVKTVTGENSLVISNVNLLNIVGTRTHNGVTTTGTSDGKMVSIGTTGSSYQYFNMTENYKSTNIPAGDYVFSIQSAIPYKLQIIFYDANQTTIVNKTLNVGSTESEITLTSNASYYRMAMVNVGLQTAVNVTIYPMIRLSTVTDGSFVPHEEQMYPLSLGNIELCKIGDYQDYIYKSGDNWYKKQLIGKKVLDGSESNYGTNNTQPSDTNYHSYYNSISDKKRFNGNILMTHFKKLGMANIVADANTEGFWFNGTSSALQLGWISKQTSLSNFKTWLSTNNVTIYYALETPTDIQITDTTLISQLNDIYENAQSYNGTTNVTSTYVTGNEQMVIDASALKSWSES